MPHSATVIPDSVRIPAIFYFPTLSPEITENLREKFEFSKTEFLTFKK